MTQDRSSPKNPVIDQGRVRRLFARPERLADSAFLRCEIADRMHERLSLVRLSPERVLDAGCGDGGDLARLAERFPDARVLGADISAGMLGQARKHAGYGENTALFCADFGCLPLPDGAVEMLWSNLALHWHPQAQQACAEWKRVLKLGGLLMFSCFGPDTLKEVRTAFEEGDAHPNVLPFVGMHELGDMLLAAGFPSPVLDRETITVTYGAVDKLFSDVRAFGGNALVRRRRGLFGKDAWARARQRLDETRNAEGRIALSFEIVYGHAFRDEPAGNKSRESPVHFMPRRLIPDD